MRSNIEVGKGKSSVSRSQEDKPKVKAKIRKVMGGWSQVKMVPNIADKDVRKGHIHAHKRVMKPMSFVRKSECASNESIL